ncbi:MAG: thiamine pyrophosphate-dependent enzyme [Bacillota bacterium]
MTVREAVYRWLEKRRIRRLFGNPGSTELPMLTGLPPEVEYVLALHEAAAVAMADGYAQGTGRPALVNLHVAPGVGNAMGALFTARKNKAPMVVTAGQQDARHLHWEPLLAGDLVAMVSPVVKWAQEARMPEQVPALLERAWAVASLPPQGPAFLSIPMNFWDAPLDEAAADALPGDRRLNPAGATGRSGAAGGTASAVPAGETPCAAAAQLREILDSPSPVALVAGAGIDRAGSRVWSAVQRLAEKLQCPVYGEPLAPRAGFPTDHPQFRGYLLPAAPMIARELAGFRTVILIGAPAFLLYPYLPGPMVPPSTRLYLLTDDPDEAARAPAAASWVGDLAELVEQLAVEAAARGPQAAGAAEGLAGAAAAASAKRRAEAARGRARMEVAFVLHTLARLLDESVRAPVIVDEASLASLAVREYVAVRAPSSYFAAASGGLGWGLPAAVGLKLAFPERPVVAVIGDGSVMFGVQGLWTAARYGAGVKFVVLNNAGYGILKAFARTFYPGTEERIPGLDLPGLHLSELARAMGVQAERVESPDGVEPALRRALEAPGPYLVDVAVSRAVRSLM